MTMIAALLTVVALVAPAVQLPWHSLQDIAPEAIVERGMLMCEDDIPVVAVALKGSNAYYMLWFTANGWIMTPYLGATEPEAGQRATVAWYGIWVQQNDQSVFKLLIVEPVPARGKASTAKFCDWLTQSHAD